MIGRSPLKFYYILYNLRDDNLNNPFLQRNGQTYTWLLCLLNKILWLLKSHSISHSSFGLWRLLKPASRTF